MTINKLTNTVKPLDEINKINEIIDGLDNIDPLPAQTGQAGKFLSTDGTDANWATPVFRNLGEIIYSPLPLVDAGLHLLDGARISGEGIYKGFVDYIASLYADNPTANYFTDETTWLNSVTTYGVCGKFVYDSTNNTVRLPKITGIIEGTTDVTALGDLVEAGLPNITGSFTVYTAGSGSEAPQGAFYVQSTGYTGETYQLMGTQPRYLFDASRSSSIYGGSPTVQPQTIKAFYYIVLATSTKTDIEVDIDEIATDLNGKVNISDLQEVQCIVETYSNGTSWYRVYSDGWCEQGGVYNKTASGQSTITLLKSYANTNYQVLLTPQYSSNLTNMTALYSKATNSFIVIGNNNNSNYYEQWQACGYMEV